MNHLALAVALAAIVSPGTPPRPHILGISHVGLRVSSVPSARAFYEDFLGLRGLAVNPRQHVELIPGLAAEEDRLDHIALETDDAEALRRYLASRGVDVPERVVRGEEGRRFTVHDPDGHPVEFVQPSPASPRALERTGPAADARVSDRILHVGVIVGDVPAAMKFYGDVLGFSETWRGSRSGTELSWINMKVPDGGDYVEFMLYGSGPRRVSAGRSTTSACRWRTCRGRKRFWRPGPTGPPTRGRSSPAWARTGSASSTSTTPTAPGSS